MDTLIKYYENIFIIYSDSRTIEWPLVASPLPLLSILVTYLFAVYIYLPNFMLQRKPYKLKMVLAVYNLFQVGSCLILIYMFSTSGWTTHYTFGCQETDFLNDKMAIRMAKSFWWTFILKLIELLETIMFVLRKKFSQVSPLHVYHHATTVFYAWLGVKYYPGGMASFPILLNSFVHILMYTYYFFSSLGPEMQKRLEIVKSKLTTIQIVSNILNFVKFSIIYFQIQLVIILLYAFQLLSANCNISNLTICLFILNLIVNLVLFLKFYRKNYTKETKCG
ncbi:hypothetical protein FQA39_LY19155 [Lamprigera yunnana]|nr:hypothetical protein FQA39_LY19155 [Lamprigera yunnana]